MQSEGCGQSRRRWKGQEGLHGLDGEKCGEHEAKERSMVTDSTGGSGARRWQHPPGLQLWVNRDPQGGGGGPSQGRASDCEGLCAAPGEGWVFPSTVETQE